MSLRQLWPGLRVLMLLLLCSTPATSQIRRGTDEGRLLRDAAARESRGDFDGAESVLRQLLEADPASAGGLFALERVLRAKGETAEILPVVDALIARDAASSGVRYLKLRVLMELDSLDALEDEAERWFEMDPASEVPYREVARVYERAFGPDRALQVLNRGREAAGDDALAMEIGDVLAAMGDRDGAVEEWVRAIRDDVVRTTAIARRVQGLTHGKDAAGRRLVRSLAQSDLVPRRLARARIALELGLEPEALDLSKEVASGLDGRAREVFLKDVARQAREKDLVQTASWALSELGGDASTPAQPRRGGVERAYLLFDAGEVEEGRRALLLALPDLEPSDATEVIQLVGLMGRLSPEGAELLATARVRAHRGQSAEAARALTQGAESLGQDERPPVLAEAARIAERGELPSQAALIRERILTEFPDSPEVGEAALALARYRAASSDGVAAAIALLEQLITSRPNAAVVPDARLELERLRGRGRGR